MNSDSQITALAAYLVQDDTPQTHQFCRFQDRYIKLLEDAGYYLTADPLAEYCWTQTGLNPKQFSNSLQDNVQNRKIMFAFTSKKKYIRLALVN